MRVRYNISNLLVLSILALVSIIVTFLNFKKGYYLIGGDVGISQIFPVEALRQSIFTWQDRFAPGSGHRWWNIPAVFPYLSILYILIKIGLSSYIVQRIYFFLLLFFAGLNINYLIISTINSDDKYQKNIAGFCGAICYMFNHYTMMMYSSATSNYPLSYVWLPLLVAFFIKGLNGECSRCYYFFAGIVSIMCWTTINLAQVGITILFLFLYLIYHALVNKIYLRPVLFFILFMGICILSNAWWILPHLNTIPHGLQEVETWNAERWLSWMSSRSSILNLFRLDGYTGWIEDFSYGITFSRNPILIFLGYSITILVFSLLLLKKLNSKVLFFSSVALLGIFLAKGIHSPFGSIYRFIYKYIPGFHIFRSPYDKFIVIAVLGYAWLIGVILGRLYMFMHKKNKILAGFASLLLISTIGGYPWPFWKGGVVRTSIEARPSFWVKIPEEYYKLSSWINSQRRDSKILILPPQSAGFLNYSWGYFGENIFKYLLNKPIFMDPSLIKEIFLNPNLSEKGFLNLLRFYNIEYIVLDKNIKTDINNKVLRKRLNQRSLSLVGRYGRLYVFLVNKEYLLKKIYLADEFTCVYGQGEYLSAISNVVDIDRKVFLISDSKNRQCGNYFSLWDRPGEKIEISVLDDSEYTLFCFLVFPLSKKKIGKGFETKYDKADVDFKENNVRYTAGFDNGGMDIKLFLDGVDKEDEYLQIKKEINVDLEKYPWFEMEYKVGDGMVQTIEIVIGIDINGDNEPDDYVRGLYPRPASEVYSRYRYCVYEKVKSLFPKADVYKAVVLEIYPHKVWGVDCSSKRKGWYEFWIMNVGFYKLSDMEYLLTRDGDIVDLTEAVFNEDIFKLDGKKYSFKTRFRYGQVINRIICSRVYLTKGTHYIGLLESQNFEIDKVVLEKDRDILKKYKLPKINYRMINPVRYEVDIEDLDNPIGLVFSESFDPGWAAWIDGGKKILLDEHYMVNGYANGWWIDPNKIQNDPDNIGVPRSKIQNIKDLKIIIEYKPQRLVWTGFIISISSLGLMGLISIMGRR